jgi:hypothetical protein
MFERSFLWAMKHGARILFAVALLIGALIVDRLDKWLSSKETA